VTKACDGGDGLHDGLITDPRTCHWDPSALQCPNDVAAATCLTRAQAGVVRAFYTTPHDSTGRTVYPGGLMRGSEEGWADGAMSPLATIQLYNEIVKKTGGPKVAQNDVRLSYPLIAHYRGTGDPNSADSFTACSSPCAATR
jgi:hypothetical protein